MINRRPYDFAAQMAQSIGTNAASCVWFSAFSTESAVPNDTPSVCERMVAGQERRKSARLD